MNDALARQKQARRTLALMCWCLAFGLCVVAWAAGVPRLASGLQAWRLGGPEAAVASTRGWYKGRPTGGGSESARSAIEHGLGWCGVGAIMTAGLTWTFTMLRPPRPKPPTA